MISYSEQGLDPQEVAVSRAAHGTNVITPPRDDSAWRLLAEKFCDPIIIVLLIAAALSLAMAFVEGDFIETIGILCAVLLATCVGFLFEWDAMRRFRRLNRVDDDEPVKVRRGGAMCEIPRREVVVGDLVIVEAGETVPADGELIEAVSLRMDESTLTGELETAKYVDEALFDPEATYPSNRLLRGTTVRDGYGMMVVTAVGDATEAGRVTEQATVRSGGQTPLHRQLTRLSKQIGKAGITLSAAIFVLLVGKAYLFEGLADAAWPHAVRKLLECFMISVAMIVMAVPEGLPMSITLSLALSMRRMLRTDNLVRRMHACETMGAVTVICTDKTGTLTRNRMRVEQMLRFEGDDRLTGELIAANTTAFLTAEGRQLGNPTEGALLEWLQSEGGAYAALREGVRILDRLTFTTERKYMATLAERCDTGERFLFVKGAPEVVAAFCDAASIAADTDRRLLAMQRQAMRTLALAYAPTTAGRIADVGERCRLAAIAAIADPVREEVPAAVAECMAAGIAVKIVTGDTPATAIEIARRIGLWNDSADTGDNCMTGAEFAAARDEELLARIGSLKILARARPLDKQRLVRLLQRRGEVVAVTGDGTNDAPALNFADVGLSMGSGTSVAKDASDITLLDDSFRSIATAVLWGRSLYRNIQRFILFQLTVNFAAIVVFLAGSLMESEMPLTVTQILWVNIIMDTLAAMAMASLPPRHEVMRERPRRRDAAIVTRSMIRTIAVCGTIFVAVLLGMLARWRCTTGEPTLRQLTVFFTTFVFLQFWNLFNAKGFEAGCPVCRGISHSRTFLFVLAIVAGGQWAIVTLGGGVFRTVPLAWHEWAAIVGSTSLIAIGGEAVRILRRHRTCGERRR